MLATILLPDISHSSSILGGETSSMWTVVGAVHLHSRMSVVCH